MAFMLLGSLPFVLYVQLWRKKWRALATMSQVRWFVAITAGSIVALAIWRVTAGDMGLGEALRYAGFNVIAVISTTGFVDTDYGTWGPFAVTVFFFLLFVGGCTGSTSGGLKIFRVQVLYLSARLQLLRLIYPHGVIASKYDGRAVPETVPAAVLGFFFLFILAVGGLTGGLTLTGLDFLTSISGAATAIANVGPGLGDIIGPSGTFQPLPDAAKWLLSFGMLLGRLELFTVLILLVPRFWTA
jgi:trk system potassium uptake protein TrkH